MAMEMVCGNCQGRLLVEQTGVVVACPHCGTHLSIGEIPSAATAESAPIPQSFPPSDWSASPFTASAEQQIERPPVPVPWSPVPNPPPVEQPGQASLVGWNQQEPPPVTSEAPVFPTFNAPAPGKSASTPRPERTSSGIDFSTQFGQEFSKVSSELVASPEPAAKDDWMPKIDTTVNPQAVSLQPAPPSVPLPVQSSAEPPTVLLEKPRFPEVVSGVEPQWGNFNPTAPSPAVFESPVAAAGATPMPSATASLAFTAPSSPTLSPPKAEASFGDFGSFTASENSRAIQDVTIPPPTRSPSTQAAKPNSTAAASAQVETRRESSSKSFGSRILLLLLASYSSAITIALVLLWIKYQRSLLDLPDLVPTFQKNRIGMKFVPENPLPENHRMKLGESRQFGHVILTPLKVTRGPLEFQHFSNEKLTKPPSQNPVLKLWLKFENVSDDQVFPALDENLLYTRLPDKRNAMQEYSNNYVCRQAERKPLGKRISVYYLPIKGEWLLKDQDLDRELKPKDSWETYVATNDQEMSDLEGPLSWRLHFRKGYNPVSYRGVTTVVEIEFNSDEIGADS